MKHVVMSAYDKKARAYLTPFFVTHVDVAVRTFTSAVNDPTHPGMINKHPEDFCLYHLGTFDDDTGHFNLTAAPVVVCEAAALRKPMQLAVPQKGTAADV